MKTCWLTLGYSWTDQWKCIIEEICLMWIQTLTGIDSKSKPGVESKAIKAHQIFSELGQSKLPHIVGNKLERHSAIHQAINPQHPQHPWPSPRTENRSNGLTFSDRVALDHLRDTLAENIRKLRQKSHEKPHYHKTSQQTSHNAGKSRIDPSPCCAQAHGKSAINFLLKRWYTLGESCARRDRHPASSSYIVGAMPETSWNYSWRSLWYNTCWLQQ